MTLHEKRLAFEASKRIYDSALLSFQGVEDGTLDGTLDGSISSCSTPFTREGRRYLCARVEPREDSADSRVILFEETSRDHFTPLPDAMQARLEIPSFAAGLPEPSEPAPYLKNLLGDGEWGGSSQICTLSSGKLGIIGNLCCADQTPSGQRLTVCVNAAFVIDPDSDKLLDFRIIGTRPCYPPAPAKRPDLIDFALASGITLRHDGKCDLYALCGGTHVGRITVDYPFGGFGDIVERK